MSTESQPVWRLETKTDIDGVSTYQAWTDEPTEAVRQAALVLSSADTTEATCYGWVPQAHAALDAALIVDEVAEETCRVLHSSRWDFAAISHACDECLMAATAVRAAVLGVTE